MRSHRQLSGLCLALMLCGCAGGGAGERPSIVLFYIDDMGWRDLGVQGSGFYETPRIDRLAAQGMRFTQAYSNAPNCAPSRASLLSGLYGPRHGIYTVAPAARGRAEDRRLIPAPDRTVLDTSFVTLAEALRGQGYATGFVGKWHLGGESARPVDQGFDVAVGGDEAGSPASYSAPYRNARRGIPDLAGTGPPGEYLTDRLTDEAETFLRARGEGPFFLMLSHYAVHTPIRADSARTARFAGRDPVGGHGDPVYAAMIAAVDESVGRILDLLGELGRTDGTIVIFTSDNGGYGPITDMSPLRGAKGMLYEGGIRVPLIVRWPGVTPAAGVSAEPVLGTDWYPTLARAAGGGADGLDGRDLAETLRGAVGPTRTLYWHFPAYLEAYRGSQDTWRTTPASALRWGRWKVIHFFETGTSELYDLETDPGETRDLATAQPDTLAMLVDRLQNWWKETGAYVPAAQAD